MPEDEHDLKGERPIRSFGRIKGRTVKPRQADLLNTLLPALTAPRTAFDPHVLAPEACEVWLEIGFGGGEHLAGQAAAHPEVLILAAEPFVNGVASALRHLDHNGARNVRLHQGDGRDLIDNLPDASLDRVFILFPDPWPKLRHHKRRLIEPKTLAALARVMKPAARLRFATDWRDYAAWTLERMQSSAEFAWTAKSAADWRAPPADHLTTRYEMKRLGDCAPVFLEFERR